MKPLSDVIPGPSPLERACPDFSGGWGEVKKNDKKDLIYLTGLKLIEIIGKQRFILEKA